MIKTNLRISFILINLTGDEWQDDSNLASIISSLALSKYALKYFYLFITYLR